MKTTAGAKKHLRLSPGEHKPVASSGSPLRFLTSLPCFMKLRPLLFLLLCASSSPAADAKKPNVLFIAVDDLKPLLGCYGDKLVKSPNIDRLAKRGVLFEKAYTNQAVCSPSRNALLTGLRPQALGIYDLGTNFRKATPDAVTLPQYFQKNGYRTEALGKIFHVGHGNHEDAASWSVPHFQAKTVQYARPENKAVITREEALFENKGGDVSKLPRGAAYESADVPDTTYGDGVLAEETIGRLRAAKEKPDQPWFIGLGFLKPHLPFCAPKKYWDLYDPASIQIPERRTPPDGAPKFGPSGWGELRQYRDMPATGPVTDDQARTLIHGYYAAVSYMDAQLGRVLDALDELDLAKQTVIVLWGDHGWHLGDHGQWCKHTNYEEAAHIPLIVCAPDAAAGTPLGAGTRTQALVESVDLYPTLCELAGLPAPSGLNGASFAALLRNPAAQTKDHIIHVYPRGEMIGRAIRTARHRLVEWRKPNAPADTAVFELYDYQADPGETKNLAESEPQVVSTLRAILANHPEAKPQIRDGASGKNQKPPADRNAMFLGRDKNGDGKLTREEFLLNQPDPTEAPKRFDKFDANKDGTLSREEFVNSGNVRQ
jgi:iduronate 2-sulfatase